ncbi:heme ABC transporter permease [Candidatus Rariloculus sp.]|uniref:heme ABC transporter permease n=1 Tax=Candidatus Rariloculus sp. TaxID=3101265 RepID=UPI003D0F2BB4
MKLPRWFHRFGSPPYIYSLAGLLGPWVGGIAVVLMVAGAFGGLVLAPPDYLQGDSFRIIYIHVPSAYVSMMAYVILAVAAGIGFIWRLKLAHAVAVSAAPIGASFTFLALVTGAIWGKPTWGTFWQWTDPRIMFELVLLFLYLGYMALRAAFEDREKADRVSAILGVVGVVNVPIIHYSVIWWNTLHQGPTISRLDGPTITPDMLVPLLLMIAGFTFCFAWLLLSRLQGEIVEREHATRWLRELLQESPG